MFENKMGRIIFTMVLYICVGKRINGLEKWKRIKGKEKRTVSDMFLNGKVALVRWKSIWLTILTKCFF